MKRGVLLGLWGVCLLIGGAAGGMFAAGVVRDTRPFDPVLPLDLTRPSDWTSAPFRLFGAGRHRLFLATVNHDSTHLGAPLEAALEVAVRSPDGAEVFRRAYGPGETGHTLPGNYADVELAVLELDGRPWRRWTLAARVTAPDPRFGSGRTEVKLYRQQYDPGMGGLVNYVMAIPAGIFLALAGVLAIPLATRHRVRWPLVATTLLLVAFGLLLTR